MWKIITAVPTGSSWNTKCMSIIAMSTAMSRTPMSQTHRNDKPKSCSGSKKEQSLLVVQVSMLQNIWPLYKSSVWRIHPLQLPHSGSRLTIQPEWGSFLWFSSEHMVPMINILYVVFHISSISDAAVRPICTPHRLWRVCSYAHEKTIAMTQ